MILLVKRKQILCEGDAVHLRGDGVVTKLVDKGRTRRSMTPPPPSSLLLGWGAYSRRHTNARHRCFQH